MSSVTSPRSGIWFVYRSLYEGMAGKRIRRLPGATVLAWFQRMWAATAGVVDLDTDDRWAWAEERIAAELDGEVYGLGSVFVSARERGLAMPTSWQQLRDVLHQAWELPDGVASGEPFDPAAPVRPLLPATTGEGATYVVLPVDDDVLWYQRSRPWVVPGVRLPGLADWLRTLVPQVSEVNQPDQILDPHRFEGWPEALLLLRALVAPGEERLGPALERCNRWPDYFSWGDDYIRPERRWLLDAHELAHARA